MRRKKLLKRGPQMVAGFKRADGKFMAKTRISNSTFIDHPQKLDIEDNVFIGHHNYVEASNGLTIEEGCQITNFITITTHSSHKSIRLYGPKYAGAEMVGYVKGSVFIGKYTFVGPHSTIMPGTKIGKGSLVSAYSYVQGDFPDFSIISGNPAQVTGSTKDMDAKLLEENPDLMEIYKSWAE